MEKMQLASHSQNLGTHRLTSSLEILKNFFKNHLNVFWMACGSLIASLYKGHLSS